MNARVTTTDKVEINSIARGMVAVPEGVSKAPVRLHDERRYSVLITVVCPEFSPEEAQAAIDAGMHQNWPRPRMSG